MHAYGKGSDNITEILKALNNHEPFQKRRLRFSFSGMTHHFTCGCSYTSPEDKPPWGDEFVKECEKVASEKLGSDIRFEL